MKPSEARQLQVGQRVRWQPLEPTDDVETGKVTANTGKHVRIQWDDEDFDRIYPIEERDHGLAHIERIK